MDIKKSKIFVINLDRSSTRWDKMREQLEKLNLTFERFSAIDGKFVSDDFLNRHYSRYLNIRKYYVGLSKSEIACYISHLNVCKRIISEDLDYGIVLEDDLLLNESFKLVPTALSSIKGDWEYIKLISPFKRKNIVSRTPLVFDIPVTYNIERCRTDSATHKIEISKSSYSTNFPIKFELVRWNKPPAGTQAYAITKEGAKEFLAKRSIFFRPIDVDLQFTWETKLNVIGLYPSLCELQKVESDIVRKNTPYHYPMARLIYKLKYAIAVCFHKSQKHIP